MNDFSDGPDVAALSALVGRLARAAVLVVGDAILDRYVFGDVERISPEAPVPVLTIRREIVVPGGAGNVVRNLGALGASAAFVSVVGDDQAGSELTGLIGGQPRVEPWLLVQGGLTTTLKTRFVAGGQHMLRADREEAARDDGPVHPKLLERMTRIARDAMAATSVTILSDYRKGVLAGDLAPALIAAARASGRTIVADTRGPGLARFAGAAVLVTSWRDVALATGVAGETDATVEIAGAALRRAHDLGAVVIVRAGFGLSVIEADRALHMPSLAAEIADISGVGDAVVAVLGAALAAGGGLADAAALAVRAAAVSAARIGTAVIRPGDLLASLAEPNGQRVVGHAVAAERLERWRAAGLRVGLLRWVEGAANGAAIARGRAGCERLAVVVDAAGPAQEAARAGADLVLIEPRAHVALDLLRPDVHF